jgi:peptidyl-dipeptidase A
VNGFSFLFALIVLLSGCDIDVSINDDDAESADEFVARVNGELDELTREVAAASWVRYTYITVDTALLNSLATQRYAEWQSRTVADSLTYEGHDLSPATARALGLLKFGTEAPAPSDEAKRRELSEVITDMTGMYGAARYCPDDGRNCMNLSELTDIMAESRDYDELLDAWTGWRTISPPMRQKYQRFTELANEGAEELGFQNLGELWKSAYDMSPAEFEQESLRLWEQVKPLYDELHCHVRAGLSKQYGEDKAPLDQPIPAHLLGDMWAQSWDFLYDLFEPYPGVADIDVDRALAEQKYTPIRMVESAERFYVSMGLPELPDTFWERSLFSKPTDREVVCHAFASGLDGGNDVRIKMCIKRTYNELRVIYHELGHNYYQAAYKNQPPIFRDGAHSGFHEAIGDTVTLSMTPSYLQEVGLISAAEDSHEAVINRQMQQALATIASLPWTKLVDEWRWNVFSGVTAPENYNKAWWDLRTRYQGVAAPVSRSEEDFDPGAKFHVPANYSYTRYFLARVLEFQFHRALCDAAGREGPLHECSIYGSKEAGAKFNEMLEAGQSQPWQLTLEKLTGAREMDATAIIDYFAPLMAWLKTQNEGRSCGW